MVMQQQILSDCGQRYNHKGKGKGKGSVQLLMEFHFTAIQCHLPYGITQCYLPPDTSEHTPP